MKKNTDDTEEKQKIDRRKTMPHLFKKGQSGNPNGRPSGSISIVNAIKIKLNDFADVKAKKTYLDTIVEKIFEMAKNGNEQMLKLLTNYIDGMPKQAIDLGTNESTINALTNAIVQIANDKNSAISKDPV